MAFAPVPARESEDHHRVEMILIFRDVRTLLRFTRDYKFHRALRISNHKPSPISAKLTINQTSRA
jgi:hypothetical protein